MTHEEKCTLMLMFDSGRNWHRRMPLRVFYTFCLAAGLLLPLLAGASWLAWELYRANTLLEARFIHMEQENAGIRAERTRLANLEQLLEMPGNAELLALHMQTAKSKAAGQTAPPPDNPPPQEPKDQNQSDAVSLESAPPIVSPVTVDMGLIGVENVLARLAAGDKLRITLDLHNSNQKNQLMGYVACSVKNMLGETQPLEVPQEVANFRINRFKHVVLAPRLPAAIRNSALTVIVEVYLEERGVAYRSEFPIER